MEVDLILRSDLVGRPEVGNFFRPAPLSEITPILSERIPRFSNLLLETESRFPNSWGDWP